MWVAQLPAERAELVAEHERTVDEILAVGVNATHLPDVQQRRAAEAAQVRAEENLRLNQARAKAILDAAEA